MAETRKELNALEARTSKVCGTIERELALRGDSLKDDVNKSLKITLTYFQNQLTTIDDLQNTKMTHNLK